MSAPPAFLTFPALLWTATAEGHWTLIGRSWSRAQPIPSSNAPFGFELLLHPDDQHRTAELWSASVQTGVPFTTEFRLRMPDGTFRWHSVRAERVDPASWTGICTDLHDLKRSEEDNRTLRASAVQTLGLALEAREHETKGHSDRVTELAVRLGTAAGLDFTRLEALRLGAYLHDVGKLTVPDAILLKPGPLTAQERLDMQAHVVSGERFATSLGFLDEEVLQVIRSHHERWDGSGYPDGLERERIPLLARIFALADVYDALVSERPYKRAWSAEEAMAEMLAQSGHHFDPELTSLMLGLLNSEYRRPEARPERRVIPGVRSLGEREQLQAMHHAPVSILITDAAHRLVYANAIFCQSTEYMLEEIMGRNPRFLQGPETSTEDRRIFRDALATERPFHHLILNYSRSGKKIWFQVHITPIFEQGTLTHFVAVQLDHSAQVLDRQQLEWNAHHDALTGLPNRAALKRAFALLRQPSALIFMDLNDLKRLNDQFGHQTGDQLLIRTASLLQEKAPADGQVFRLGGDEFLTIMPIQEEHEAVNYVDRVRAALSGEAVGDLPPTGSFGSAFFPREGDDPWALMRVADERMYHEKRRQGRHRQAPSFRGKTADEKPQAQEMEAWKQR